MTRPPFWHLDQTPSTQDVLKEKLQVGEGAHGASVLADVQTAGRGRQGRVWQSLPGNYCASIWLETARLPLARRIFLSYLTGVVLYDLLKPLLPSADSLQLKWPNDLLLNGQKLAGILIEPAAEGHLIGIGLNLQTAPEGELRYPAIALSHLLDATPDPMTLHAQLLPALLDAFDRWQQQGDAALFADWQARAQPLGTPIKAELPDGSIIPGEMAGLSPDGQLQIRQTSGELANISVGDIIPTLTDEGL